LFEIGNALDALKRPMRYKRTLRFWCVYICPNKSFPSHSEAFLNAGPPVGRASGSDQRRSCAILTSSMI